MAGVVGAAALPGVARAQGRDRTMIVSALDASSGQPVESLSPRDVIVREDGVAREVLRVSPQAEPMNLAILVDNSTAVTNDVMNIREGLRAFVQALDAQHRISLVTCADRPTLVIDGSRERDSVLQAIDRIFSQPNSGAYLLDAIQETSQGFVKRAPARPVIVALATEGVEFSNGGYQRVLEQLASSGAQFHVLQLVGPGSDGTDEVRYRSIVIDRGTRTTGGRRENLLSSMSLTDALTSLAAELDHQWTVVYGHPESLLEPDEVTISATRPDLEVRGMLVRERR